MAEGYWVILIGHVDHDEIAGTSGEAPGNIGIVANVAEAKKIKVPNPDRVAVLTQTTLSVDDTKQIIDTLGERFPNMITPPKEDICYATQNRQDAVKELTAAADLIFVIGSPNSEKACAPSGSGGGVSSCVAPDSPEPQPKAVRAMASVAIEPCPRSAFMHVLLTGSKSPKPTGHLSRTAHVDRSDSSTSRPHCRSI